MKTEILSKQPKPLLPVRTGLRQTAAAKTYGVSLRAVNKWMAIDKVGGLRALKPKRRGRRLGQGGRVHVAQAQRIRSLIVGTMPDQLKLPFYLWTRAAVARWLKKEYPAIARQARRDKAAIYWDDEMGLCKRPRYGDELCPGGRNPRDSGHGPALGGNMLSAITNKGALAFIVFQGKCKASVFVAFLQRLLKQIAGKIYLIVDGHPVHKSGEATRFAATNSSRLRLIRLPAIARS